MLFLKEKKCSEQQNKSEIRFGAYVKFRMSGCIQDFKVDGNHIKEEKIAFTSLLDIAIISKKKLIIRSLSITRDL